MKDQKLISDIRSFNRFYTNVLGLLDRHILNSDFSLTEVRLLYEISRTVPCSVNILSNRLQIDRSYMSRMIKRFERDGLITKTLNKSDNRMSFIELTQQSKHLLIELDARSNEQIEELIAALSDEQKIQILKSMNVIKKYLATASGSIQIRDSKPQDIEYIISRQVEMYKHESGLISPVFAEYVEQGVRKLAQGLNKDKECIYILDYERIPSGCIAIRCEDEQTAQLRYFFLEPEMRGMGAGHMLIDAAVEFCRAHHYKQIFLLTISAQHTARILYAKKGFAITETHPMNDWGTPATEERWELIL